MISITLPSEIPSETVRNIILLNNKFENARSLYIKKHPNFDGDKDARITIFSKVMAVLEVISVLLLFKTFNLKTDEWWEEIQKKSKILDLQFNVQKDILASRTDMVLIYSYFLSLFASLESSFRILVKIKDKKDSGTGDFPPICKKLLGKDYTKFAGLIDLIIPLRNTSFHNNGVYYHKSGLDRSPVVYKGVKYYFRYGKKIDLKDSTKLLFSDITPDLFEYDKNYCKL